MTPDLGPTDGSPQSSPPPQAPPPSDPPGSAGPADEGRVVLTSQEISRALRRMAHEIVERHKGAEGLVLLGIPSRGVPLATRLAANIADVEGVQVPTGSLDVTMYRDDLRSQPTRPTLRQSIPACGIDGRTVVLVDDVLYSGRTIRAALDAMSDLGRPTAVRLAVLVDRGHRDLPIRADHVGKNLPTSASERVRVRLLDVDDAEEVRILQGARPGTTADTTTGTTTGTAKGTQATSQKGTR